MRRDPTSDEAIGEVASTQGWRAGAVRAPRDPRVLRQVDDVELRSSAFRAHRAILSQLGSQPVYAAPCRVRGSEDCDVVLVRFSGAIESAFGLTREVLFFYSPYSDLQNRTFSAAKSSLRHLPGEVTPDLIFFHSRDQRAKVKLDDWSSTQFLAIPLPVGDFPDPLNVLTLMREYIFARDLYYETTPVSGDRFFGRRPLLQSIRDDIRDQRVVGVFGLRKAGKTSVLAELGKTVESDKTIFLLRDLESLPSPPDDPVPELVADLRQDLIVRLAERGITRDALLALAREPGLGEFRRHMQVALRQLAAAGAQVIIALDEIEYLVPADRIDIREGDMPSIAQFLGVLRSLVQENPNFTFLVSGLTSALIESGRLYGRPNPLFSWAKTYFISPFSVDEAAELAQSVGHRMGVRLEPGALSALYEATGGHAFLYRHLASAVVADLPLDVMQRTMTRADVLRAMVTWRREVAGNIEEMASHVGRYYPDEAFLLETLRRSPGDFVEYAKDMPSELGHLIRLGLVEESRGEFSLTPMLLA